MIAALPASRAEPEPIFAFIRGRRARRAKGYGGDELARSIAPNARLVGVGLRGRPSPLREKSAVHESRCPARSRFPAVTLAEWRKATVIMARGRGRRPTPLRRCPG